MLFFHRLKKFNFFVLALIGSAIFHVLFILYVKFEAPARQFIKDQTSALEVILVNKKSKHKPKKADVLAQTNLDGGGNTKENRRLKSALTGKTNKTLNLENVHQIKTLEKRIEKTEAEAAQKAKKLAALEKQAQSLMSQLQSDRSLENNLSNHNPISHPEKGNQDKPNQALHGAAGPRRGRRLCVDRAPRKW